MRETEKPYPCQSTTPSPLFLTSSPAPSPRSSQATRLTTSRSSTVLPGLIASQTQKTRSIFFGSDPHCSQGPMGFAYACGGSGVMNEAVVDQGPGAPWYSARAFHVKRVLGVSICAVVQAGLLTRPESWASVPAL